VKFENEQAIWDTQNDKPVFSMRDAKLLLALYQQRERSRRRLFWWEFFPMYTLTVVGLVGAGVVFWAFLWKSIYIEKIARDFPMTVWDYAAFAVVALCLLLMGAVVYAERKEHELTQNVFAPSLREELGRGIAQTDFTLGLLHTPRILKLHGLLYIAVLIFIWEVGRLNGNPTPSWTMILFNVFLMAAATGFSLASAKRAKEKLLARRATLESMRAALDEDAA
jgi:hypothetical protein